MTSQKIYSGGCHCGGKRFEVKLTLGEIIMCNCSGCLDCAELEMLNIKFFNGQAI